MKTLFYIILLVLISSVGMAQTWKPQGYANLNNTEKNLIKYLSPLSEVNKSIAQLVLDSGSYENCSMGTALRADKIYVTIINKTDSKKYRYVLKLNESLISENLFMYQRSPVFVLVFDQVTPEEDGSKTAETLFMYFFMTADGRIQGVDIESKKNIHQGIPLASRFVGSVQPHYMFTCKSKK